MYLVTEQMKKIRSTIVTINMSEIFGKCGVCNLIQNDSKTFICVKPCLYTLHSMYLKSFK